MGKLCLYGKFILIILAFGLCVDARLLTNQYVDTKQSNFIALLTTINTLRIFVIIFFIYFEMIHGSGYLENQIVLLEYHLLSMLGMFFNMYRLFKAESKFTQLIPVILVISCSVMACRLIPIASMAVVSQVVIKATVVLAVGTYYFGNKSGFLGEAKYFFEVYLIFEVLKSLCMLNTTEINEEYYLVIVSFELVQTAYLIYYVYRTCLVIHWNERKNEMDKADAMIKEQYAACSMLVNSSHELKTPINVIKSALDLLVMDYQEDQKVLGQVKGIRKDCNLVMNIIQDMIDIQRIKGNYYEMNCKGYNLVEVIENVVEAFSEEVKGVPIVYNPLEEEIYQEVDLVMFQQCLMLLLGELVKHSIQDELYIELGICEDETQIYLIIVHPEIENWQFLISKLSEENPKDIKVADLLTAQLVDNLIEVHHGKCLFETFMGKANLRIELPRCYVEELEWIEEHNVQILRDKFKVRGILEEPTKKVQFVVE